MVIAEHVYEAQLIGRFFRWLVEGTMPSGYTNPSHQWVDEVLLGLGPTSRIVKEPAWVEDNLWLQLTHGLGGDKQLWRLALADEPMNIRKSKVFGGPVPSADIEKNNIHTRRAQRNVSIPASLPDETHIDY